MEVSDQLDATAAFKPGVGADGNYVFDRRLGGLQSQPGRYEEDKNLLPRLQ
jgi:hypothetical protein